MSPSIVPRDASASAKDTHIFQLRLEVTKLVLLLIFLLLAGLFPLRISLAHSPILGTPAKAAVDNRPQLLINLGHSGSVKSISFSADGARLLTGGLADKVVILWDANSRMELRRFEHAAYVSSVALSPDGTKVLTGTGGDAVLWDAATGKELRRLPAYDKSTYSGVWKVEVVAFSPDGSKMLAAGGSGLYVWDVANGQEIKHMGEHSGWMYAAAFSPDSNRVLTGGMDKVAVLWDINTGQEAHRFSGHSRIITAVGFSPDGKNILTGSGQAMSQAPDKTLRKWDVETGKQIGDFAGYSSDINSIAFSKDGSRILTASGDLTARLWDNATGQQLASVNVGFNAATAVAFMSRQDEVLIAAFRATIWDIKTAKALSTFEGSASDVTSVAFSADGKRIATGAHDERVSLWDTTSGQLIQSFKGHSDWVRSVAFSANGSKVLSSGNDSRAILWDTETGSEVRRFQGHSNWLTSAVLSPDGRWVAAANQNGAVQVWEAQTGAEARSLKFGSTFVFAVAFSPDGRQVAGAGDQNLTILWDAATGKEIRRFVAASEHYSPQYQPTIFSVAFSPDGKQVLTGGQDGIARLWEVATGEEVRRFQKHTNQIFSVAFSPDGKRILTGSSDDTAILWNAENGAPISEFAGHVADIESVAFSPDGNKVLTGSEDGTTRLWRADTGEELCRLISFKDGTYVVVSPDGRFDTNNLEEIKGLHWVMPDDPFHALPLEIFMRQYYEPRLLPRILTDEKLRPVPSLAALNRSQPTVTISRIEQAKDAADQVNVTVEVSRTDKTNVYDLRLFRDGQIVGYTTQAPTELESHPSRQLSQEEELNYWRRSNEVRLEVNGKATFSFPGIRLPHRSGTKQIEFSAYAFNSDRVKSRTDRKSFGIPSVITPAKGRAYVITVGVNAYENADFDLEFAADDARRMERTLTERLTATGQYEKVVPVSLISDYKVANDKKIATSRDATKRNFKAVLQLLSKQNADVDRAQLAGIANVDELRPATPDDLVLIMYSSHGYADRDGSFYFIPYDTGPGTGKVFTDSVRRHSISSEELSLWLRDVDAGEMLMIVDACHSTAAIAGQDFKPGPMGSRGLGQLSYDKGMRILTATQSDNVALEDRNLKQGLLTYALIRDGIDSGEADYKPRDGRIVLTEWLSYGVERVPVLYNDLRTVKAKQNGQTGTEQYLERVKIFCNGKELEEVDGDTANCVSMARAAARTQLPSLFDFSRRRGDVVLVKLQSQSRP